MKRAFLIFALIYIVLLPAFATAEWVAYSTDQSNFQVITFDTGLEVQGPSISAGRSVELAITPDGSRAYVLNRNIPNSISVIDLTLQTVINTIILNSGGVDQEPFGIAITPDGLTAYITCVDSLNIPNVLKLDLISNLYTTIPIATGIQANSLAITPDGSMLYLTQTSALIGMTTAGNVFGTPINIPGRSTRLVIAPDGAHAYVSDMINSQLYEIDLNSEVVSLTIALTSNSQPNYLAISADGQWIYLANENANFATALEVGIFVPVDVSLSALPGDYTQHGIAITPDSQKVFLTNTNSNQIAVIDVGTFNVRNNSISGNPGFMAITPDQAPVASFNSTISPPLIPSTFTSTSTTLVGSIANYLWDFGDGTILSTTLNPVQHTYASGGLYQVSLTVTNTAGTSTTQTFTGQVVSNNGGPSAIATTQVSVPFLTPVITSISPSAGLAGDTVSIIGANFTGATSVEFGGIVISFSLQSDNLIIVTAPAGLEGAVAVTVSNPSGSSQQNFNSQFTYLSQTLAPPIFLEGYRVACKFLSQTDYVDVIKWKAPEIGNRPAAYLIYQDAALTKLLARIVDNQPYYYEVHNRKKRKVYHYYLVSEGEDGEVSNPVNLTIHP